jgi:hypothetical protein
MENCPPFAWCEIASLFFTFYVKSQVHFMCKKFTHFANFVKFFYFFASLRWVLVVSLPLSLKGRLVFHVAFSTQRILFLHFLWKVKFMLKKFYTFY